ncbi:MAG: helix-turn-helix transcriptional regulator [Candidatus Kariarchaeaceae archaeon]|jgi:putative transcriptional regulator
MGRKSNAPQMVIKCRLAEYRNRLESKYNQQEVANLVGTSRQTISAIESGNYNPSLELAYRLAKLFDVQIEDIFIFEEGP